MKNILAGFLICVCFVVSAQSDQDKQLFLDAIENDYNVNVETQTVIDQITFNIDSISGDTTSIDTTFKKQYRINISDTLESGTIINDIIPYRDSVDFMEYWNDANATEFRNTGRYYEKYVEQVLFARSVNRVLNEAQGRSLLAWSRSKVNSPFNGTWTMRRNGNASDVTITNARVDDDAGQWVTVGSKLATIRYWSATSLLFIELKFEDSAEEVPMYRVNSSRYEGIDSDGDRLVLKK